MHLTDMTRELHLQSADLSDLVFDLVVTTQAGEGRHRVGMADRSHLSIVR
ncbi:hypothetical protein H0H10_09740 [Streptomyces sp. TRM S81-3]|uniref:Uncharacterized protein n=1 Tax=Streptomyces griseicoloratus TaxID=2752516 RepID=A0A926QPJ9_9ACTN|nr:hypothetical protein [Streptomyces griseicoloratus]MBD0419438.1 hypothetical protein [Streptomyces griseicoloratus]